MRYVIDTVLEGLTALVQDEEAQQRGRLNKLETSRVRLLEAAEEAWPEVHRAFERARALLGSEAAPSSAGDLRDVVEALDGLTRAVQELPGGYRIEMLDRHISEIHDALEADTAGDAARTRNWLEALKAMGVENITSNAATSAGFPNFDSIAADALSRLRERRG